MAEYIKKLTMRECCIDEDGQTDEPIIKKLNEVIDFINLIDIAPVRHGRWKHYGRNLGECSNCGEIVNIRYNYCPNCGAKMDGE